MLSWPRSLALRAVAALLAVHVLTIVLGLGLGMLEGRKTPYAGADVALELAVKDLAFDGRQWIFPPDGDFATLAAKNPSLWLIGRDEHHLVVVGAPPPAARRLVGLAGVEPSPDGADDGFGALLSDAVIEREQIGGRAILLASGGVDPATITSKDILRTYALAPAVALCLGFGGLGLIAVFLAIPLLSRAVRPIAQAAASIHPDDLASRLDENRAPLELLPLARAFNGALDRLQAELRRRKRLISNVAHELRTPLAVLSLRADTLSGPAGEREALRAAVGRIARLVEQMLDLERLSLPAGPRTAIELTQLARAVISELAPMALSTGYDLALDAPAAPVTVLAERQALERALTNLVSNAILHGGGRGLISVRVGQAWLEVSDEGQGIPTSLEPRLFEAFARGSGDSEGSGLGLHLTREIMRALGGEVCWRREGSRTVFRLEFPATLTLSAQPPTTF
ncbi:HAMP domain-containing sensor histidine kinase [Caulobacter sp.]|uniref:HAMP domain-containing sensor histidine kinase n=1 Tax=Caulobacter sp. TaxID=78 RepID=UPI001B277121|nr:HAMP domain-containing sensor histidine kinase [Caulobacter sp.]MBO9546993.1 HAMP domain-containing histidine kinase [Caulobacter sp.]